LRFFSRCLMVQHIIPFHFISASLGVFDLLHLAGLADGQSQARPVQFSCLISMFQENQVRLRLCVIRCTEWIQSPFLCCGDITILSLL
jgi:hypothetical protein